MFITIFVKSMSGYMRLLLTVLFDFDTIVLMILLVSNLVQNRSESAQYTVSCTMLAFQLVGRIGIEVFIDLRKQKIAYQFNFSMIKKYFRPRAESTLTKTDDSGLRREGTFAFDLWQHLKIGDIIIVKQG